MGWDEKEQLYKMSGKIIRTRNITQSAEGKEGVWTTVVAAAVFASYDLSNPNSNSGQQNNQQVNK